MNIASSLSCYECDPLAILSNSKSPDIPQCAEDNAVHGDLVNCDKSTDACSQAVFSKLNIIDFFKVYNILKLLWTTSFCFNMFQSYSSEEEELKY